jgi:tape measure domain-containing protein
MIDIDTIGVAVDSSGVVKGTRDLDKFGASANKASKDADNFGKNTTAASKKTSELSGATNIATSSLKGLAAAYIGLNGARALIGAIDNYTKYNAQLRLATRSQDEYNQALRDVSRIANVAQSDLSSIAVLYARINNAARDLGATQNEVTRITENVGLALKVSGATAQESASAMLQLSQAFGAGVLRGEEFNAVNEAAPALMRALAESIGVPIGQLRTLASEGLITGDVLIKAFGDEKLLEKFRDQAKEVQTIAGAWQTLKNEVLLSVGAINEATGASNLFIKSMTAMSNFIGKGSPFQLFGFAARATQNRLGQALGTAGGGRGGNGNQLPGLAAITGGNYSPNFSSTIEVQNIDKIHQKQEEAARKAKEYQDKLQDALTTKKLGQQQLYWEREARLMEEKLDGIIKEDKLKAKLEKEDYEQKKKYMDLLQKQANANFDEAQKKVKELADETKRISDELGRSLTDALFRGFESGKSFAKNFKDTLLNTFRTLILRPIVSFIVDSSGISKAMAAFGSVFSGNAAAGGGTGNNSIAGMFSQIKDVFSSGNASIVSSIQDLGVFLSNGQGGLGDMLGGAIGQYSAEIANVLPYAGAFMKLVQGDVKGAAFTAAGTAIGSIFGPIGAGIGAVLGSVVGSLFGGKDYDRFGTNVSGSRSVGGQYAQLTQGVIYDKPIQGAADPLNNLNKSFVDTLAALFTSFGADSNIWTNSGVYQRGKSKKSGGIFDAAIDGELIGRLDVVLRKASMEQVFAALVDKVMGEGLVKAIQASKLSEGVKKFFDGMTKKEDVLEAIQTLTALNVALADLPPVFNAVRNAIDTTAYSTTISQLQAQFSATQSFVNLFYTQAEKMDITFKQLTTQFDALNLTVPSSKDAFRALVESINVTDEATRNQFNGLLALAPAFATYFDQLESGITEVNEAIADGLNQNLFSTFADFASARASAMSGIDSSQFMARVQNPVMMNEAMANEIKQLRAENAETKQILSQIAFNTAYTAKTNKQWNGDGLPETRVY